MQGKGKTMSICSVGFWIENPMNIALHHRPTETLTFTCPRCPKKRAKTFTGTPEEVLEAYREHVYYSDHAFELEDCGCCGCQHFPDFHGDCREDFDRF